MEIINCEQGTDEWLTARLGVATSSEFDKIITPTGKKSSQIEGYANKLVAEIIMGKPTEIFKSEWMERGNELEAEAVAFYEMVQGVDAEAVGFVKSFGVGCSPDRLIGDDGLLEVKVPAPHTHAAYLLGGGLSTKYKPQTQGQLYVTGRQWVDTFSYHPEMPPVIIRSERDEGFIDLLKEGIEQLHEALDRKIQKAKDIGAIKDE